VSQLKSCKQSCPPSSLLSTAPGKPKGWRIWQNLSGYGETARGEQKCEARSEVGIVTVMAFQDRKDNKRESDKLDGTS